MTQNKQFCNCGLIFHKIQLLIWKTVYAVFFKEFLKLKSAKLYRVVFLQDVFETCFHYLPNCTRFYFVTKVYAYGARIKRDLFEPYKQLNSRTWTKNLM